MTSRFSTVVASYVATATSASTKNGSSWVTSLSLPKTFSSVYLALWPNYSWSSSAKSLSFIYYLYSAIWRTLVMACSRRNRDFSSSCLGNSEMYFYVGGKWLMYVSLSRKSFMLFCKAWISSSPFAPLNFCFACSSMRMTLRFSVNFIFLYFVSNNSASFCFFDCFLSYTNSAFFAFLISSGKPSRSRKRSMSLIYFLVDAFRFFGLNWALFRWNSPKLSLFFVESRS